jgi:hypothetical protein
MLGFMPDDEDQCQKQTVKGVHTIAPHHLDLDYNDYTCHYAALVCRMLGRCVTRCGGCNPRFFEWAACSISSQARVALRMTSAPSRGGFSIEHPPPETPVPPLL